MSDFEAAVTSRVSAETWLRGIRAAPWFRLCNVMLQSFCGGRVTLPPQVSHAFLGRFSGSLEKARTHSKTEKCCCKAVQSPVSDFEAAVTSSVRSFCGGGVNIPPQVCPAFLGRFSGGFVTAKIERTDRAICMILMQVKGSALPTHHSGRAKPAAITNVGILRKGL